MPRNRNSYGDRALDAELDGLRRRIDALETRSAASTTVINNSTTAKPDLSTAGEVSFVTMSKYMTEPALVPAPLSFVSLSRWEAG